MDFPSLEDLHAAIEATSRAIDGIVNLVPSQYWFAADIEEALDSRFHKHKKRVVELADHKKGGSAVKRARLALDDDNSVTARQAAMSKAAAAAAAASAASSGDEDSDDHDGDDDDSEDGDDESNDDETEADATLINPSLSGPARTVAEQRAALQAARVTKNRRKLAKIAKTPQTAEEKRKQRKEGKKKQKKQRAIDQIKKASTDGQILSTTPTDKPADSATGKSGSAKKSATQINEAISFGNIEFGEDKKKKRGPANKDVKGQLARAEREEERIAILEEQNPEKAKAIKERTAWKKAIAQAAGDKIKDDTALLKKAVKRKEKEKMKQREGWSERKNTVADDLRKKVKKRTENIQARIDQKKSKKTKAGKKRR